MTKEHSNNHGQRPDGPYQGRKTALFLSPLSSPRPSFSPSSSFILPPQFPLRLTIRPWVSEDGSIVAICRIYAMILVLVVYCRQSGINYLCASRLCCFCRQVPGVVLPDGQRSDPNHMELLTATERCNINGPKCWGFLFSASTGVSFQHSFTMPRNAPLRRKVFYIKKEFAALYERGMEHKISK